MKATIKDIARACEVSVSLVSRVINDDPTLRCSKEKRERILKEVENQKFIPDYFAKNLANNSFKEKKNTLIGYITYKAADRSTFNAYFDKVIEGITTTLESQGYNTITYYIDEVETLCYSSRHLAEKKLDGLILFGSVPEKLASYLSKESKYISSIYVTDIPNADFVGSDIMTSMNVAIDYVKKLGFETFGFITGGDSIRDESVIKYAKSIGLQNDPNFTFCCRNDDNTAYIETINKLKTVKPPKMVVCMNDEMAIGVMNALTDNGYKIPDDVSIIGHDDIKRASYCSTPLTTIKIYKEEIGRLIADLLIERINSKRKFPIRVYVPYELVIRKSTIRK